MELIFNPFIEKRQRLTAVEFTQTLLYIAYDFLSFTVGKKIIMFVLLTYIIS